MASALDAPPLQPFWRRCLVATFLAALVLPGAGMLAGVGTGSDAQEKRTLAERPRLSLEWPRLAAWPDQATRYFEDHFAWRSSLVRWQAMFRFGVLGVSPSPDVIIGRDGWLFYAGDGSSEDFASAVPFTPSELDAWRRTIQDTADWLRGRGIAYVFAIAPDKYEIYPEALPSTMRRLGPSRIDGLVRHLRRTTDVPVVDLREALLEAKARERVYHLTDTHWNDRGAFAGYTAIMSALRRASAADVPAALPGPLPRKAFDDVTGQVPGMDLAAMMGLSSQMKEIDLRLAPRDGHRWHVVEPASSDPGFMEGRLTTAHRDQSLPRAVVFRDSFGSALVPFVSGHFSRVLYLWQYNFDPAVVEAERPAVVIQEWVGRRLSTELPYNAIAALREPDVPTAGQQ